MLGIRCIKGIRHWRWQHGAWWDRPTNHWPFFRAPESASKYLGALKALSARPRTAELMFEKGWPGWGPSSFMPVALLTLLALHTTHLNLLCYAEPWITGPNPHFTYWDSVVPLCLASSINRLPLFDRARRSKHRKPRRTLVFCFGGLKFDINTLMSTRYSDTLTVLLPSLALHHRGSRQLVELVRAMPGLKHLEFWGDHGTSVGRFTALRLWYIEQVLRPRADLSVITFSGELCRNETVRQMAQQVNRADYVGKLKASIRSCGGTMISWSELSFVLKQ